MKRILTALLALAMIFSLAACTVGTGTSGDYKVAMVTD